MFNEDPEIESFHSVAVELQEITDALTPPSGVPAADWAEYCADALEGLLEAAGLVSKEEASGEDEEIRRRVFKLLTIDDLLIMVAGKDLPADHPFLRWVRDEVPSSEVSHD